jgi:hypothetical protein
MVEVDTGQPAVDWNHDPRNPRRLTVEEQG